MALGPSRSASLGAGALQQQVLFSDAIGVKAQKPTRQRRGEPVVVKELKRHETDVLLLPRRDGSWHYLSEGVSGAWSLVAAARSFLAHEWQGAQGVPLVAISDGAQTIRTDWQALSGDRVRILLDWYH